MAQMKIKMNWLFLIALIALLLNSCRSNRSKMNARMVYQAQKNLMVLEGLIYNYIGEHEKIPADFQFVINEQADRLRFLNAPKTWKENGKVLDPWGKEYQIHRFDNKLLIYSLGLNQLDEGGHGDDLVREISINLH